MTFEPAYLALFRSGELAKRADALEARLAHCDICPRECGAMRLGAGRGHCNSGRLPIVASVCAHHGEEPALSGTRGSGTIFFGNCNMRCVYCQNHQISQGPREQQANEVSCHDLAGHMLALQSQGCHNINLVTPSHFVPQIVQALAEAAESGLRLPLVYNTGGYDSLATLKVLDGIVDIYLPDLRYADDRLARKYSNVHRYVEHNRAAIKEMYRQVGDLKTDDEGVAQRGLIVRHLVLPNGIAGSEESLTWLAKEVSPAVAVSVMSQYFPVHRAHKHPELNRPITRAEYDEVVDVVNQLGLENGWLQQMTARDNYRPDFEREGHPFEG